MLLRPDYYMALDVAVKRAQARDSCFAFAARWPSDDPRSPYFIMAASPRGLLPMSNPVQSHADALRALEHVTGTAGKPTTCTLTRKWTHVPAGGGRRFEVAAAFYERAPVGCSADGTTLANRYIAAMVDHRPVGVLEVTRSCPGERHPRIILAYLDDFGVPS